MSWEQQSVFNWLRKKADGQGQANKAAEPSLPLDLLDAKFVANPYPTYAWLRAHQPICEIFGGGYLLTRYEDIRAALTNAYLGNAPSRFSTLAARNAEKYVAADLASHISPFLDGEDHVKMRQMTTRAFFNSFNALGEDVDTIAQAQVADLKTGDDLMLGASQPFALRVMCAFCGIAAEPLKMKELTQSFFHLFAPLRDQDVFGQVNAALASFRAVIAESLKQGAPEKSLLSEMQRFQASDSHISDAQIVDNCLLVFADGVENIEAAAASLLLTFEKFTLFEAIERQEFSLVQAVQEGLRLQTPAQLIPRVARADFDIRGVSIKKDLPVFLSLASANRDEAVWQQPDMFDPLRDKQKMLTFGQGRHRCIGEPLAMLQLTALMGALLRANIRPAQLETEYQARIGHRWPERLVVKKG